MKYDVLFIDWDGTLSTSRFWGHWKTQPDFADTYRAIQDYLFGGSNTTADKWMRGRLTTEQVLQTVSDHTGIDPDILLEHMQLSCKNMTFVDPQLPQLLGAARKQGMKVVIATDNMDCFVRWAVPSLRLHLLCDDILSSHELRAFKREDRADGSSKFFSDYLNRHQIAPGRSVLIDDGPKNQAVTRYGIDFIGVTPEHGITAILTDLLQDSSNRS